MAWLYDVFGTLFDSIIQFSIALQGSWVDSPKMFDFDIFDVHENPIYTFPNQRVAQKTKLFWNSKLE